MVLLSWVFTAFGQFKNFKLLVVLGNLKKFKNKYQLNIVNCPPNENDPRTV